MNIAERVAEMGVERCLRVTRFGATPLSDDLLEALEACGRRHAAKAERA